MSLLRFKGLRSLPHSTFLLFIFLDTFTTTKATLFAACNRTEKTRNPPGSCEKMHSFSFSLPLALARATSIRLVCCHSSVDRFEVSQRFTKQLIGPLWYMAFNNVYDTDRRKRHVCAELMNTRRILDHDFSYKQYHLEGFIDRRCLPTMPRLHRHSPFTTAALSPGNQTFLSFFPFTIFLFLVFTFLLDLSLFLFPF